MVIYEARFKCPFAKRRDELRRSTGMTSRSQEFKHCSEQGTPHQLPKLANNSDAKTALQEYGGCGQNWRTYLNAGFALQAVHLVLVLLNLAADLSHFASLGEVNDAFRFVGQEVGVALLRLHDVRQVVSCKRHASARCPPSGKNNMTYNISEQPNHFQFQTYTPFQIFGGFI